MVATKQQKISETAPEFALALLKSHGWCDCGAVEFNRQNGISFHWREVVLHPIDTDRFDGRTFWLDDAWKQEFDATEQDAG